MNQFWTRLTSRLRAATPMQKALAGVLLALVLVAGALEASGTLAPRPHTGPVPLNPAVEAKWGVRVTQIGVTADGGMLDFRFIVLDPDKALEMMQHVNNLPILIAEDSGTIINSTAAMAAQHDLNAGQTYFLLYRNTEGAVQHGSYVTVKFGDLEIQHVIAK